MEVIHERCCGLDIGKDEVVACVRLPGAGGGRRQEIRTYKTFTTQLEALATWLEGEGITDVVMEATGQYWKPIVRHEAPRIPGGKEGVPPADRRSGLPKLGAARTWKRRRGREAAPTTTGRAGTARQLGSGKQDGEVYDAETSGGTPERPVPAPTWRIWAGQQRTPHERRLRRR